jgi:hypothetical protein
VEPQGTVNQITFHFSGQGNTNGIKLAATKKSLHGLFNYKEKMNHRAGRINTGTQSKLITMLGLFS